MASVTSIAEKRQERVGRWKALSRRAVLRRPVDGQSALGLSSAGCSPGAPPTPCARNVILFIGDAS